MTATATSTTKRQLRDYQQAGVDYLTTPNVRRSELDLIPTLSRHLLTDAPGSGKSFQSTEAAIKLSNNPRLICTPAHLVTQWFEFLVDQYPNDRVVSFDGTKEQKLRLANVKADWYVISIQSLRYRHFLTMVQQLIKQHKINVVILDESHYCKNTDATTSKNFRQATLPILVDHLIMLSATPIMREADDLYMQLRILDPVTFKSQDTFLNTYCYFTWSSWGPQNVSLRPHASEMLSNWMMGRTYEQIGLALPPLISNPPCESTLISQRREAYDNIKIYWSHLIETDNPDDRISITANSAMQVMHLLRHVIDSPEKIESLLPYLSQGGDPGPYLIGCIYRASAHGLAEYIRTHNPELNPIVITGELPAEDRFRLAQQSKAPNSVVIATLPSISEGVDLSHCNTVFFYEENWTSGSMYQFLSRVRRHRNTNADDTSVTITEDNKLVVPLSANQRPVIVRYFHAAKTIDRHIHAVQTQRAVNIKDIIKVELAT